MAETRKRSPSTWVAFTAAMMLLALMPVGCKDGDDASSTALDSKTLDSSAPDSESTGVVYTPNPDLNETTAGILNAVLTNRNPDCRAYATDANSGNYSSVGADDRSNLASSTPFYPGTAVTGSVTIDLVIVTGDYIQDPANPKIPGGWNYESVTPTGSA
jgi:hypothetical protein